MTKIKYEFCGQEVTNPVAQRHILQEMSENGEITGRRYWAELQRTYATMTDWEKDYDLAH